MTLNDADPEILNKLNKLNLELEEILSKAVEIILIGVCEGYGNIDPVKTCLMQLMTVSRFCNKLQSSVIAGVVYGLEGTGIMKVIPDKDILESPEYKAMKEHFNRLKKEK